LQKVVEISNRNYFDSKKDVVKFCLLALLPTVGARAVNVQTVTGSHKPEVLR